MNDKTRHVWKNSGIRFGRAAITHTCQVCGLHRKKSGMDMTYRTPDGLRTINRGCLEGFQRFTKNCQNFVPVFSQSTDIHRTIMWIEENFFKQWHLRVHRSKKIRYEFSFECDGEAGVFRMSGF